MTQSTNGSEEQIKFPDFKRIVERCKEKMEKKFPDYKNSWTKMYYFDNPTWWNKRLMVEVQEFIDAKGQTDKYEELIDIMNICAMIYQEMGNFADPSYQYTWRYG